MRTSVYPVIDFFLNSVDGENADYWCDLHDNLLEDEMLFNDLPQVGHTINMHSFSDKLIYRSYTGAEEPERKKHKEWIRKLHNVPMIVSKIEIAGRSHRDNETMYYYMHIRVDESRVFTDDVEQIEFINKLIKYQIENERF